MKFDDLEFLQKSIQNEMPTHSDTRANVPHNYEMRLPKNLMEQSHKVQNKFLNKYLAEIEEAHYCKILSPSLLQWFLHQNRQYHFKSGILNHDGFFKINPYTMLPENTRFRNHGNMFITFPASGQPAADIIIGGTGANGNFGPDTLTAGRASGGVATELYDQIAINVNETDNFKLGVYDDDAVTPDVLIGGETGSISIGTGFAFQPITEFALTDSTPWLTFVCQTDNDIFFNSSGGNRFALSNAFGNAWPDPYTGTSADTAETNIKIGHT